MYSVMTNPARAVGQSRHAAASGTTSRMAVRRPVVSVRASSSQAEGDRPAADKVALSGLLAAAMLVTSAGGPALAASYKPNTVYNNTDFVVEAHFNYKQDASCTTPTDVGKVQPGFMLTFPRGRGSCTVNEMTAVAFNPAANSKSPVATVHWKPSDPNSQSSSKWAVLQMRNQTPSIQVVHIMD